MITCFLIQCKNHLFYSFYLFSCANTNEIKSLSTYIFLGFPCLDQVLFRRLDWFENIRRSWKGEVHSGGRKSPWNLYGWYEKARRSLSTGCRFREHACGWAKLRELSTDQHLTSGPPQWRAFSKNFLMSKRIISLSMLVSMKLYIEYDYVLILSRSSLLACFVFGPCIL